MATDILDVRRGLPVYERNPSVAAGVPTRKRSTRVANGNKVMIVGSATGELLGEGHAAFFEEVEVDREQFVKIYLAGVQKTGDLTTAGTKVFSIVLEQLRNSPQADRVEMNPYLGKKGGLSERTFRRGLRDLLDHEFLYCSPTSGVYFVNINYVFNGDRIALAKVYQLREPRQLEGMAAEPGQS